MTAILTCVALVAFAANSLLTRLALGRGLLDAASFTTVRLLSGAALLLLLVRGRALRAGPQPGARRWVAPLALFGYAAPFSFAYLRIGAAVGALVLFGAVQMTMIGWSIARGERPTAWALVGMSIALAGLGGLTLPGASAPDPIGVALMAVAGAAWGVYTLQGKGSSDPLAANAWSFLVGAAPALLSSAAATSPVVTGAGMALAVASGAVTSGLGYAIWYRAIRGLGATAAAVVQLCVPVLAALGAVALLGEPLHARLVVGGATVLGGVALALVASARPRASRS